MISPPLINIIYCLSKYLTTATAAPQKAQIVSFNSMSSWIWLPQ